MTPPPLSQARAKYLAVARQMKAFEDRLYEEWKTQVEVILPGLLKRNLLIKPTDNPTASLPLIGDEGDPSIEAGESCSSTVCSRLFFISCRLKGCENFAVHLSCLAKKHWCCSDVMCFHRFVSLGKYAL